MCAERPGARRHTASDGAEAKDGPAGPLDLAENVAGPLSGGLGGAAFRAALQGIENAPEHIVGHAHSLSVAGGQARALLDELAEDRIIETGRAALHPLQVG